MKQGPGPKTDALGFASWVFTGHGGPVTLFQVLVILADAVPGGEEGKETGEGERQ